MSFTVSDRFTALVKVSQGKLTQTSRKEVVVRREIPVIIGVFPKVQNFKSPAGCRFGDKGVYSATIATHIPANDERQMQL